MSQVSAGVGSNSSHSEATEQSHDGLRRRYLLRRFLHSASGFWLATAGPRHGCCRPPSCLVIVLLLGAAYAMNAWHRAMFDGLQNRDAAAVGRLSLHLFRDSGGQRAAEHLCRSMCA